ncbi:uncharacterized protein LOC111388851 [Olea europaea var. sylvestris]|uniref:uncharacterized protein LOC111388851 n=1 Tax=Olea europaea var. sylvestris TaxID=158386 RepID=UPI000C1CD423|nr:uncharacterized protein LOC111388851 [Olea europaea var. sylvestris]
MVNDVLAIHNGNYSWNIAFERGLQDLELDDYALLLTSLHEVHIKVGEDDRSKWKSGRDGIYSVCTYLRSILGSTESSFPWKMTLTVDNLHRKGFYVTEWCYMCKRDGETNDHLFLHCEGVRWLWNTILTSQHMDWVMPRRMEDVLRAWSRKFRDKDSGLVWNLFPGCIVWCVWRERNIRCFEDQAKTTEQIREWFYMTLYT